MLALDLLELTRMQNPTGSMVLHLKDPITGKDHYVLISDVLTGQSYDTWAPDEEYDEGTRVTFGFKLFESLQDTNEGHIPSGGVGDLWWKEVSESSKPDKLERTIAQTAHGFAVKNILTLDVTGALVKVSDPSADKFIGIVSEVIDANNFKMVLLGFVTGLTGLTVGSIHYAQADGTLSSAVESDMPVLLASTSESGYILSSGGGGSSTDSNWKTPAARMKTTGNVILSGTQTIDTIVGGVNDSVLVGDQTDPAENGIYLMKAGAWERRSDANDASELLSATIQVLEGATHGGTTWRQASTGITLGVTDIVFVTFNDPQVYDANRYNEVAFDPALTFESDKIMILNPQPGAIAFTYVATDARNDTVVKVSIKSNGVNAPTFSGDFELQGYYSYLNTINKWNHFIFKKSPSGKINYWHWYES